MRNKYPPMVVTFLFLAFCCQCFGQNFTGAEKVYLERAEKARKELAIFWTGKELPGDWWKPCSIKIKEYTSKRPKSDTGGGATNFDFNEGHVLNWSMTLEGHREALLVSIIPHEVNHMIFASLTRKPITRWLDEGCSSLFETEFEHEQQRRVVMSDSDRYRTMLQYIDGEEYPRDIRDVVKMYAAGFSLVEWLLEYGGKDTLFAFVMDPDLPSVKMKKHYGMNVDAVLMRWSVWVRDRSMNCTAATCRMHFHHYAAKPPLVAANQSKPVLYIVGTSWCMKCKPFEFAFFGFDTRFRKALESKYIINFVNGDVYRQWVADQGVVGYPSYIVSNRDSMVTEFRSKSKFMDALTNLPLKEQPVVKQEPVIASNPLKEIITPDPPKDKSPVPSSYIRKKDDQVKKTEKSSFDEEKFKNDLFEKLENDRDIQRGEFGAISKSTQESNTRAQKAIDLATLAAPTALELLGYGGAVGGVGLATGGTGWLALLGVKGLLRLRRRRKERKQFVEQPKDLDIEKEAESSYINPLIGGTIPSVNKVYSDINEENRQLKEVIREQQNENSKMRDYVQVPIQTNTELYREALDIVAKTHHASPTFQMFHKEVEEHFNLLLSGRGVN